MLSFFIALLGGAYYITKYASDKHSHNVISSKTDRVIKERSDRFLDWRERVTDKEFEREMTMLLQRTPRSDIAKMLREIGWDDEFFIRNDGDKKRILAMLMSAKGKIPNDCAGILGVPSSVLIARTRQDEELNKLSYEMALFINRNLRKHGINEKMYLKRDVCYNTMNSKSACIGGSYVWAPALPLHPDIVDIK